MAYAALLSLRYILDQILNQTRCHFLFNKLQIQSLHEKVAFLQDFLEDYDQQSNQITEDLQSVITGVTNATEDVIETKMVDQIVTKSAASALRGSSHFCQKIEELIQEFESIKKELMTFKRERKITHIGSSRVFPGGKNTMVGFEEDVIRIMDELTGHKADRQILPIVGMGGIGKTTLCRNVFENQFIVEHFHIRAWITVSQEYSVREILLGLLHEIRIPTGEETSDTTEKNAEFMSQMSQESVDQLGEQLYKGLSGRKYLIVMDDIWSREVWNEVKMFLPDNGNGSRIMVTTRLSDVALHFSSCSPYKLDFLDESKSWNLLCETVFGEKGCPVYLKQIGMEIVKSCGGLPLAIVVISGLLSKSDMTREYWEYVAKDVIWIVNSEENEHCSKILSLSYRHLPIHLKPCFLYMGVFPEDYEISASRLIKLWVAEGFLKPILSKSMEEVAEEYLQDLVDRNLVLVRKRCATAKIKSCNIHDLLRDFCFEEARKDKFFYLTLYSLFNIPIDEGERRVAIHGSIWDADYRLFPSLELAPLTRSFFCNFKWSSQYHIPRLRLLRILDMADAYSPLEKITQLVNARYLCFTISGDSNLRIPSSIAMLRNLQTIIVTNKSGKSPIVLPSEIWEMSRLRHIQIKEAILPDPRMDNVSSCSLDNLQTLLVIRNLRCDEEILKRIPNLRKLEITCEVVSRRGKLQPYYLNNLAHLHKLESLSCIAYNQISLGDSCFPQSLKKLSLSWSMLDWEDMTIIGSLPNLEVLKLRNRAFYGKVWSPIEGEFLRLKFLLFDHISLYHWEADSSHFPRLETLIFHNCSDLKEIPSGIGEIPTLESIKLYNCDYGGLVSSAEQILEEQQSYGNDVLQVRVYNFMDTRASSNRP